MSYVNIDGVDIYIYDCGRVLASPKRIMTPNELGAIMEFAWRVLDL